MKGKILDSQYNPGYSSYVLKQTKYGAFSSEVFLHDEDKDIDNSFDGCRIAEFDCNLKSAKEKAKWMKQRAIGTRTLFYNIIDSLDEETAELIGRQVESAFMEANKARDYYERMKDYRPIYIENLLKHRRETRKEIEKRKAKNNS